MPKTITEVIITDVHENSRFPGVIYGYLKVKDTGELLISATLDYIFDALREAKRRYRCVNVTTDPHGNFHLNLHYGQG